MTNYGTENSIKNVCDLNYLTEMMGNKKHLINGIMDAFLIQIPEELKIINDAIIKGDYKTIKNFSHTMKSSVFIMGVSVLTPILQEMEDLAIKAMIALDPLTINIEKIKELNETLNVICKQAIEEIEREKPNYV